MAGFLLPELNRCFIENGWRHDPLRAAYVAPGGTPVITMQAIRSAESGLAGRRGLERIIRRYGTFFSKLDQLDRIIEEGEDR